MKIAPSPVAAAVNPWIPATVRIASIQQELEDIATYDLEFVDPAQGARFRFLPGQFNMLYMPGVGEVAISISASPLARRTFAHTIRKAGNVTQALAKLAVGATLGLRGPYGSCWPVELARGRDLILVAGGIGLAPLRPVIYQVLANREDYRRVTILYGARGPETLLYPREFAHWRRGDVHFEATVDRATEGWPGAVGVVTLLLERLEIPRPDETLLFACGPEVMMHYTARTALGRRIDPAHVWLSTERNMQCAIGLCGHCQFGPVFVCREGPVFAYPSIAPYLTVEGL